jgi:antitoxin component YwqK of YwqJK toxin-antitoxin module
MKRIVLLALAFLLLIPAAGAQDAEKAKINKKNLVIKEWNSNPKGTGKVLDHVTTYNPEGKKIEEIEYNSEGQKWRKRFEYGPDGKVSRELIYDGRNRLQTYKTFEYNEFSRKKVQYTYSAKGKLLSVKHFEYIAQDAGQ